MWVWLAGQGLTPCSMQTAARIVTERFGENHFTARQTNADVVRKRTADIVKNATACVVRVSEAVDADGVRRDQYDARREG